MLIADEKDHEKEFTLRVGDEVEIILFENPSTGYLWSISTSKGIDCIDNRFDSGKERIGSGGHHHWTIRLMAPGTLHFQGSYMRSWEKTPAAKKFEIQFKVTGPGQ